MEELRKHPLCTGAFKKNARKKQNQGGKRVLHWYFMTLKKSIERNSKDGKVFHFNVRTELFCENN